MLAAMLPDAMADTGSRQGPLDIDQSQQGDGRVLLQADEMAYDQVEGVWRAEGRVEAVYADRILLADRLTYDDKTGLVVAEGRVAILEPSGAVLMADRVELTDDLRNGVVESFSVLFREQVRMAARRAEREDGRYNRLAYAVYSPCEVCAEERDGEPLWQIKAERIIHDQEAKEISYRNARLEVFGVPVVWVPFFSHPDPTVSRKSGFLTPDIGTDSELGTFAELPYYYVIAPNMDVTVAPLVTSRERAVLKGEFRHRLTNGRYQIAGSMTVAEELDDALRPTGGERFRGHLFADSEFRLPHQWKVGADVQLTSDDTYMRRYNISNLDRLTNNLYARRVRPESLTTYDAFYFQGLREDDEAGLTPYIPVFFTHRQRVPFSPLGGDLLVDANLLLLERPDGPDTRRASVAAHWERSRILPAGILTRAFAELRGDVYQTNDADAILDPTGDSDSDVTARILPTAGLEWRWPFLRPGENARATVEPIVQLVWSPYGGNPDSIPNEDSVSFEFDDTNLFAINKFPGLDRWEGGPRANVGVEASVNWDNGVAVTGLFGQTFRLREDTTFAPSTGLDNERSDYVGRLTVSPFPYLDLVHRFRLDRDDFDYERAEVAMRLGTEGYNAEISYVALDEELDPDEGKREEIAGQARIRITDEWSFTGGARRDLENDSMIRSDAGFVYEDECLVFTIAYARRFTRDRDIEPSTSIVLRLDFKTLGN